jgi:formylglycine-generating enzyme required for sulfatase activity
LTSFSACLTVQRRGRARRVAGFRVRFPAVGTRRVVLTSTGTGLAEGWRALMLIRSYAAALLPFVLAGCSEGFRTMPNHDADASILRRESPFGEIVVSGQKSAGSATATDAGDTGEEASAPVRPRGDVSSDAGAAATTPQVTPAADAAPDVNIPSDAGAVTRPSSCGAGKLGPKMASVATPSGAYCIDETEVTVADYAAFLASNPSPTLAPATVCAWKTSFVPAGVFPPPGSDTVPVSQIDWCDAAAYCTYAGKRLCGKVGGGASPYTDYAKPTSEWYFACSGGGKTTLPYGNTFDPSACVGLDYDGVGGFQPATDLAHPVGTAPRCEGALAPFDSIRDMAGNVAEWEDSCESTGGSADYCHVRGDSYREGNASTMACGYAPRMTRSYRAAFIGFRCCE